MRGRLTSFASSLALFALLLTVVSAADRVDFGPYTLDSNTAKFVSTKQTTNVIIQTSDSLTKPQVVITVYGHNLPDALSDEFIKQNNNGEFNIDTVDPTAIKGVSKSSMLTTSLSLFALVGVVAAFNIRNKAVCMVALGSFALIQAQDELRIEITLTVPTNTPMESFSAQLAQGGVTGSAAKFSYLTLDMCSTELSGTSQAQLTSLGIRRGLTVCAKGAVQVPNVKVLTTAADIDLTSQNDDVTTNFVDAFAGTYSVNSQTRKIDGDCVKDDTSASASFESGVCRHGKYSTFKASGNSVTVDFATGCPADPEAVDFVPASPAVSTLVSVAPTTWVVTSGSRMASIAYTNDTDGSVIVNATLSANYPTEFWLAQTNALLFVRNDTGFKYRFSFEMSSSAPELVIAEVRFAMFVQKITNIPTWAGLNNTYVYDYQPATSPAFVDWKSTWVKFEGEVSSPILGPSMQVGAYIRTTASLAKTVNVVFRNLHIDTIVPDGQPSQLVQAGYSELVQIRRPSSDFDPNPRDDCPHLQSGLSLWHKAETWGGAVPSPSSVITLPANTKVLITSCSLEDAVYEKIVVPSTSELIFSDAPITLNVKAIKVDGHLRMGSPTCRLFSDITITLYGQKTTDNTIGDSMGSKGIGVDGSIDLHGKQYHQTWTRLATTAYPGDNYIWIQEDVNWHVGQQVVVVTTRLRDEETKENEVMTIQAINGRQIQFQEVFKFIHYGGPEYQGEVGLLSRRIVVQGADDSEAESFGGHIMVRGEGRFSGVRGYRLGQTNQLARYPFHFHLLQSSPQSFIRDCTIHRSFYRCVSIHDTHEINVLRNVAFDVTGHCYYLEEGVEENNTIAFNLAAHVHVIYQAAITGQPMVNVYNETDFLRLPADVAASGFYITNGYNHIYGNAASGGWAGFAFPNLPKPIGFNQNTPVIPQNRPVIEFDSNTAHSSGFSSTGEGIPCIYMGGKLWNDYDSYGGLLRYDTGRQERNPAAFNTFTNTKTFSCQLGVMFWGSKLEITKYESYDCVKAGRLFNSFLDSALVSATTPNTRWLGTQRKSQGFEFYDTGIKAIITNVEYRNFLPSPSASLDPNTDNIIFTALTHSDVYKPQGISAVKNIKYTNVPDSQRVRNYYRNTGSSRYFNIIDWDGTTAGRPNQAIIGSYVGWWNFDNTCVYNDNWKAHVCDRGTREIASLAVNVPGLIDFDGQYSMYGSEATANFPAGTSTLFYLAQGVSRVNKTCLITRNPQITGVTQVGWHISLDPGTGTGPVAPRKMRVGTFQIPFGQWVLFASNYPAGTTFNVTVSRRNLSNMQILSKASSLDEVMAGSGDKYYFSAPHLYIKMIDRGRTGAATEYWENNNVRLYNVYTDNFYNIDATCTDNGSGFCTVTNTVPSV